MLYVFNINMFINVNFNIKFVSFYYFKMFTIVINCITKFV